jgi:single-stranded-DNA-specific exonuclease
VVHLLENTLQLHPLVAHCLALRVNDPDLARVWLRPSLEHLHDPYLILGMGIAVARIRAAVVAGESIRIVTDYDVDGTTSSLILQSTLRILGVGSSVDYHIPDRFHEGYGFSVIAAEKAATDGVGLIITADIGVRDHAAVDAASAAGVDVIICDHHLPSGASVPTGAVAVLCPPQAGCDYPNKALAACGVSLKLATALLEDHPRRVAILRSMLKVAAIGTVADVVDLSTRENRAIVAHGLQGLRNGTHAPGLHALLEVSGVQGEITAEDLGFRLGPRINAAGRLAKATTIIELFDERDPARARAKAIALDGLNTERQKIQRSLVKDVLAAVVDPAPPFVVVWGAEAEGWHRGVVGIVAAKVRDAVHRPTAVIAVAGDEARGSVRSVPGIHAVAALDSVEDLLLSHGGHPAAAGFSCKVSDLEAIRSGLERWCADGGAQTDLAPEITVDVRCDAEAFRAPDADILAQGLSDLAPYGKGNPAPVIQIDGVKVSGIKPMGEAHIRMSVGGIDAVWWNGRIHSHALTDGPISLVGSLGYNNWRGRRSVRFTIKDARPFSPPSPSASPPDL